MVIVMNPNATGEQIKKIIVRVHKAGLKTHIVEGEFRTIIGIIGDKKAIMALAVEALEGVEKTVPISSDYKLVSSDFSLNPV